MKKDPIKYLLILGMVVTAGLLVREWSIFKDRNHPAPVAEQTTLSAPMQDAVLDSADNTEIPSVGDAGEHSQKPVAQQLITVQTDTLSLKIDTQGGDIVYAALPKHYAKLHTPDQPFVILNQTQSQTYVAQSGLVGRNGTDSSGQRPVFATSQSHYQLQDNDNELVVDLIYQQGAVGITKRFTLERGSYVVKVNYLIDNRSDTPWTANLYGQLKRDSQPVASDVGLGLRPYLGAAITTEEKNYRKVTFEEMAETRGGVKVDFTGGWVSLVQHYFISAWVPPADTQNHYQLRKAANADMYYAGFTTPPVTVAPGQQGEVAAQFYVGPKDVDALEALSPHLDLTVDYGWLWWLAKPIFAFLHWIHTFVGNWGWSIIVLTIIIKAIFFPLSAASYKSMAKMRKLGPLMQDLKERYGDDRQKMSAELMKIYKREKVNPMGGCLPILIQMPVFLALYWVLMESVELRHAPFMFWIADLSVKDPYFVLPIIMGATQYLQFKLNPTPPDPTQAKVMQMMPIVMTFLFMWFPSGLVLYWVVNNSISIIQQYVITKQIEQADSAS